MRNAVRQVGCHAGDVGEPCLAGRPLRAVSQSLSVPGLSGVSANYIPPFSSRFGDPPFLRASHRHSVSIKNRRKSLKTLGRRPPKSSHILRGAYSRCGLRFPRFESPFSIFGVTCNVCSTRKWLSSRNPCNSLKTNGACASYPQMKPTTRSGSSSRASIASRRTSPSSTGVPL